MGHIRIRACVARSRPPGGANASSNHRGTRPLNQRIFTLDMRGDETRRMVGGGPVRAAAGVFGLAAAAEMPAFFVGVVPSGDEANPSAWTVGWAILLGPALGGHQLRRYPVIGRAGR